MAYSFLSRFRIQREREDEFVTQARAMEDVARDEAGTLAFQFFRLGEPGVFAVFESFVDEAAEQAHMTSTDGKPLIDRMIACMAGDYEREMLYDL